MEAPRASAPIVYFYETCILKMELVDEQRRDLKKLRRKGIDISTCEAGFSLENRVLFGH